MKFKGFYILGVALSVAVNAQVALAEDTQVPDETNAGTTRGIMLGAPVGQPPVIPKVTTPPVQAKPAPVVTKQPAAVNRSPKTPKRPIIAKHKAPVPAKQPAAPVVAKAQPQVSTPTQAQAVSFSPVSNASNVITAVLDRPGDNPKYSVGDKMVISVAANQDCNLVVFNYDSNHVLTQIFPNDYQTTGFVRAGETVQIGGPDSPFDYQVAGKGGQERIFVYAYPTGGGAPTTIAMAPLAGTPFRSAELTPEQYRQMVNESKIFFSREVKITPKKGTQLTSTSTNCTSPNKIELVFSVGK